MKKTILNVLLATIIFGGGTVVFAQNNTSNKVFCTQEAKQCPDGSFVGRVGPNCEFAKCPDSQGLIPKTKNSLGNKNEETKDGVSSSTEKRFEGRYEQIVKKYLKTIEREEAIVSKIESRISKIKLANGTTTDAQKLVADAKVQLMEARTDYETLKTTALNVDKTTITKEILTGMKNGARLIEKHLQDAHKLLQKTIGSLQGVSQFKNASSTKRN